MSWDHGFADLQKKWAMRSFSAKCGAWSVKIGGFELLSTSGKSFADRSFMYLLSCSSLSSLPNQSIRRCIRSTSIQSRYWNMVDVTNTVSSAWKQTVVTLSVSFWGFPRISRFCANCTTFPIEYACIGTFFGYAKFEVSSTSAWLKNSLIYSLV